MTVSKSQANYSVICTKTGSIYKAVRNDGITLKESSRAEDVIQAALNNKGLIYFPHDVSGKLTTWDCTSRINSSTAFTLPDHTYLIGDAINNVFITVPQGYSGNLFKIGQNKDVTSQGIKGIGFFEQGSAQGNWTGIKFEMTGDKGCQFCRFEDIVMYTNKVGVELEVSSIDGWVNSNIFQNIVIFSSTTAAFLFDLSGGGDIESNTFTHCIVEVAASHGFKDVDGKRNMFYNCQVWDSGSITDMNIKSSADRTAIIGGRIGVNGTYTNLGTNTYKPMSG